MPPLILAFNAALLLADIDKLTHTLVFAYEAGGADERARAREGTVA